MPQYFFLICVTAAVIGLSAGMILLTLALIKPIGKITPRTCGLILMGSLFLAVAGVTGLLALAK
jgi:hypothetical protein